MELEKRDEIPFPVAQGFAAGLSSETVIRPATEMDALPEVGGHYRLFTETPAFDTTNEGTFSIVEPEQRVVYTREWNHDGEVSTIDVCFAQSEIGTGIHILHSGFEKPKSVAQHDSGWDSYLAGLTAHLSES